MFDRKFNQKGKLCLKRSDFDTETTHNEAV